MRDEVLFVCNDLTIGGAERHWCSLVASFAKRDVPVAVGTLRSPGPLASAVRDAGVPVVGGPCTSATDPRTAAVAANLRDRRPAVVVTLGTMPGVVGVAVAAGRATHHVVNHHEGPGIELRSRERFVQRGVFKACDRVIAVTRAQVPWLQTHGVPADRIRVIPSGVDASELAPTRQRDALRSSLGVGPDDIVVLMLGALRAEKRPDLFAAAVAAARVQDDRVCGLVAGPGTLDAAPDGVRLLGPRSDVGDLLRGADLLCLASDHEALPLAVLEAMSVGLPVVATAVGDVPVAIEDGVTGLLVPPRDRAALTAAILRLAADEALRRRLAQAARRKVEEAFSWERMVDEYSEALGVS